LINTNEKAEKVSRKQLKNSKKESEKYYVPCRNVVFLTYALALAESIFIKKKIKTDIFVGFKNEGEEAYPDTTPEFVKEMNKLSKVACRGFKVSAPLIKKDKEDIIRLGDKFGVDFRNTYTCYVGCGAKRDSKKHCGSCLSCRLRQEGFYWANIKDPTEYKEKMRDFRVVG